MKQSFITELGLNLDTKFLSDRYFYLALVAAPLALLVLTAVIADWSQHIALNTALLFSFIVWQPIVEEVLFRGVIQGQLMNINGARLNYHGISLANLMTSVLFMSIHLINHSVFWALSVILPSLIFGYFRDRHRQIYPSLLLHSAYNACYLAMAVLLNQ